MADEHSSTKWYLTNDYNGAVYALGAYLGDESRVLDTKMYRIGNPRASQTTWTLVPSGIMGPKWTGYYHIYTHQYALEMPSLGAVLDGQHWKTVLSRSDSVWRLIPVEGRDDCFKLTNSSAPDMFLTVGYDNENVPTMSKEANPAYGAYWTFRRAETES